ncbi:MAG: aminotransferase class V-fold PLP-dependent enzyme [Actinomycetota bacterium]|nr:aminotransferase class V-fold PLP-dependent enzyme [Actinomycetota bacterium]
MADLLSWRDEFPVLERQTYLISASLGPLSNRSRRYLEEFLDLWASVGSPDVVWFENIFPTYAKIKAIVARLTGARPEEVALAGNISVALSSVLSMFPYRERNKVVMSALDFPTDHHVVHANARRGYDVVTVPSRDGHTIETQDFIEAIDERTQLVIVNRVLYRSSALLDVRAIAERAHSAGALVLVDDFQGAGVVPIDVWSAGADFYTTGVLKWLMGGGGLAVLLVRGHLIPSLESEVTGWWAQKPVSYFESERDLADDATRFETGTTAGPVAYLALGGLEIVDEVGVDVIRARNQELTERVIARADELGLDVVTPRHPAARGGLVRVLVPDSKNVWRALLDRGVVVDERAGGLRFAPHFFTTEEEVDTAFDTLRALV